MPTSLVCRKIFKDKLGLRYGSDIVGAAYALSDFGDEFLELPALRQVQSLLRPLQNNWERLWDDHYYNTLVNIKRLADSGSLLVVSLAFPDAERYHAGTNGTGDHLTFKKCNRLQPDSEIIAQINYTANDDLGFMNSWIEHIIEELPDPGNNFF